jgi:hypothetical protein
MPEERSARYGRVAIVTTIVMTMVMTIVMTIRARCGFAGACDNNRRMGRAFAGPPPDCYDNRARLFGMTKPQALIVSWSGAPCLRANRTSHETALDQAKPA